MAMSHANCDHPSTPADRAKCRRHSEVVEDARAERASKVRTTIRGTRVITQPREARTRTLKASHDLADVPHAFGEAIRWAWEHELNVETAHPYNDNERRVVIASDYGWLTLVWKDRLPYGVSATMWRPKGSSVTTKLITVNVGLDLLKGNLGNGRSF